VLRDRAQRVVVDLAAGEDRDLLVEQVHELPHDPALRLAAQAEQDEVLPGEQRVHDLRHDRVLVADMPGKSTSPAASRRSRFERSSSFTAALVARGFELREGGGALLGHRYVSLVRLPGGVRVMFRP
jgi:hypothetical protein